MPTSMMRKVLANKHFAVLLIRAVKGISCLENVKRIYFQSLFSLPKAIVLNEKFETQIFYDRKRKRIYLKNSPSLTEAFILVRE